MVLKKKHFDPCFFSTVFFFSKIKTCFFKKNRTRFFSKKTLRAPHLFTQETPYATAAPLKSRFSLTTNKYPGLTFFKLKKNIVFLVLLFFFGLFKYLLSYIFIDASIYLVFEKKNSFFQKIFFIVEKKNCFFFKVCFFFSFFFKIFLNAFNLLLKVV